MPVRARDVDYNANVYYKKPGLVTQSRQLKKVHGIAKGVNRLRGPYC